MGEPTFSDSACSGSPPLVLGGARGRRVFYLDADGWMRGVTYRHPWRDGENVAECMVTKKVNVMAPHRPSTLWLAMPPYDCAGVRFGADPDVPPELLPGFDWDKCDGLDPECACGFYAYHDGYTQYAMSGPGCRVTAVVEAYGRVVLGTTGYRAEKARILGVVKPASTEASMRRRSMEGAKQGMEQTLAAVKAQPGALLGRSPRRMEVLAATSAILAAVVPHKFTAAFLMLTGVLVANAYIFKRVFKEEYEQTVATLEEHIAQLEDQIAGLPHDYSDHIANAMNNYPNVRFFETTEELAKEFPIESLKGLVTTKEATDG